MVTKIANKPKVIFSRKILENVHFCDFYQLFFFVGASSNEKGKANVTDLRVKLYKKNQKMQSSTPPSKSTKKIEEDLDDYVRFLIIFEKFFLLFFH